MAKGKIAAASFSGGSAGRVGPGLSGKAIEDAMGKAVTDALKNGITDPDEILKLKLAAREKVKKDFAAASAKAAKSAK